MSSKEFDLLGKAVNELPASPDEAQLDSFPNKHKMRNYIVEFHCADFMSMCPITQQSDFDASLDLSAVQSQLLDDINGKLSQDIINRLTSNW